MMKNSWKSIESEFFNYYQGEKNNLSNIAFDFLKSIDFVEEDGNISEVGSYYLDSKYIFENNDHHSILRDELLNLREIRELCQSFYGQKTKRENVERFFKSKTEVSQSREVGRILGLLNRANIVSYNTRKGSVQFKETNQVEEEGQESYRTTRRTPYSNLARFRKAIRACAGDLLWIDGYFTKKGLEPLAEEVTGEKFETVRILSGPEHVAPHVRDDFERFVKEMSNRDIDAEMRVITEKQKLRDLHDRWILSSDGASWNIPPINSIYGNQEAEIHKTEKKINFEDWWDDATDIIDNWNGIQKFI